MKSLTANELQDLKNNFEFRDGTINSHFERSKNKYIYFPSPENLVFYCLKCSSPHYFEAKKEDCNCGNTFDYHFDKSSDDEFGIFCRRCGHGFTNWVCKSCKTSNPVEGTFQRLTKKGGACFIATAVYGSPFAYEVTILKEFRDNYLLKNALGNAFVKFYYWISPPIANQIYKNNLLKKITKTILIIPLLKIANSIRNKEK